MEIRNQERLPFSIDAMVSRRTLMRTTAMSGGALVLGSLFGLRPGLFSAKADEASGSILFGDPGTLDDVIAAADLYAALDQIGYVDYSSGVVSVDSGALNEVLAKYLGGDTAEGAYQAFVRHAELGFAVNGDPEAVMTGRAVCVPWSAVEYLVGDGQYSMPIEVQYALLRDLGIMSARSETQIARILAKRFVNVPPELGGKAQLLTLRAFPAAQDSGGWITALFKILQAIGSSFKLEATKVKKDILACISTAMVSVQWWGMRICFDADCAQTVIEYMRAGGSALTSASVLSSVLALGFPFWVAAIIAGGLITWGVTAKLLADAMQRALDNSGGRGACIDVTWLFFLGIPALTASPHP